MIKYKKINYIQFILISVGILLAVNVSQYFYEESFLKNYENIIDRELSLVEALLVNKKIKKESICLYFQKSDQHRLTVVDSKGEVICDSVADSSKMDNHFLRPEIKNAFINNKSTSIRFSKTINSKLFYGAKSIWLNQKQFVIRKAMAFGLLDKVFYKINKSIYWIVLPLLILLSLISGLFSHHLEKKKEKQTSLMKKNLFYNIAHEVKTPLTSIKGYIQAISFNHKNLDENIKQLLKRVERNSERIAKLFDDILDLASMEDENQKNEILLEEIPIQDFTQEIINNLKITYKEKNMKFELDCNILMIESDYKLLEHVVINLIENAIKYSKNDQNIIMRWFKKGEHIVFEVEDQGLGIEISKQEKIFDRFYRIDASRDSQIEGTGLGLSIVKHALILLDAQISLKSTTGKGSLFSVVFASSKKV